MTDILTFWLEAARSIPSFVYIFTGGAAVSTIALLGRRLARRSSAAQRHFTLTAGVMGLLIVPLVVLAGPELKLGVLPAASARIPAMISALEPVARPDVPEGSILTNRSLANLPAATSARRGSFDPRRVLIAIYLTGLALVLIPLAVGILRLRWIVRRAERWSEEPDLPESWSGAKPIQHAGDGRFHQDYR